MDLAALGADLAPTRALSKATKPDTPERKKLYQACQDFESIMIGQVFKRMHASAQGSDPLSQGAAGTTWREMFDDELSKSMAKGGGMGLADSLYRQLANLT